MKELMLADAHCHLADPRFADDVERVVTRARESGVVKMIAVGALGDAEADRATIEIAESYEGVYAVVGVHPHNATELSEERILLLRELARSPRVVAIGETGLDFHYMRSPRGSQHRALEAQLELARELKLPTVIHCRAAETALVDILRRSAPLEAGIMIHCFSADAAMAKRFLDLGAMLSFSGMLTFKNAGQIREAAKVVPSDRLLVETDSPYLTPEPYRGLRNEPCYLPHTALALAELRSVPPGRLAEQVLENTERFFGLSRMSTDG